MSLLFVASEAGELEPFAQRLENLRKLNWPLDYAYEGISDGRRFILIANGAGPKLAMQATEVALRAVSNADLSSSPLEAVISTGYAGAIDPALKFADIVVARKVIDAATNEHYSCCEVIGPPIPGNSAFTGSNCQQFR